MKHIPDPHVDPKDTSRWIEVRGQVKAVTDTGAEAHADLLTQRYI